MGVRKTFVEILLWGTILVWSIPHSVTATGITVPSGATFTMSSGSIFTLPGNWNNDGIFVHGDGTVIFDGAIDQSISNPSGETFYTLKVEKSTGDLRLNNNVTVVESLVLTTGDLDLNGNTIALGTNATLHESPGNTVKGTSGSITTTRALDNISSENVGGLGASITTTEDMGSTVIDRGHGVQTLDDAYGIERYYDITPTNNSGLNATLVLNYDDSELNSVSESSLSLYRSTDEGATWSLEGGIVNTTDNTVTLSDINSFSRWTAGSETLLELPNLKVFSYSSPQVALVGEAIGDLIELHIQNDGVADADSFNVGFYISDDGAITTDDVLLTGGRVFVNLVASGETVEVSLYSGASVPEDLDPGNYFLGSLVDELNVVDESDEEDNFVSLPITIDIATAVDSDRNEIPEHFHLGRNYPNPFNPVTAFRYDLPEGSEVTLTIYDILGRQVRILIQGMEEPGYKSVVWDGTDDFGDPVSAGVYLYRIQAGDFTQTRKMILLR
ncbi:MAG: T9SS type A sorting domain-containing protein [Candidatus Neomarinimicrobiota bacterium]